MLKYCAILLLFFTCNCGRDLHQSEIIGTVVQVSKYSEGIFCDAYKAVVVQSGSYKYKGKIYPRMFTLVITAQEQEKMLQESFLNDTEVKITFTIDRSKAFCSDFLQILEVTQLQESTN